MELFLQIYSEIFSSYHSRALIYDDASRDQKHAGERGKEKEKEREREKERTREKQGHLPPAL